MKKSYPVFALALFATAILVAPTALGATSQDQNVTATLQGQAPLIITVTTDQGSYSPTESSTTAVQVDMEVYDPDGYGNLNTSTFWINLSYSSVVYHGSQCGSVQQVNDTTANCTVTMNMDYYDFSGTWTVEAYAEDIDGNSDTDTDTQFTYNQLKAWTINKNTINYGSFYLSDSANFPDSIVMNNTGNVNQTEVNVTAYDLIGQTNPAYSLPVNTTNFRASIDTTYATATGLVNATAVTVSGAYLDIGSGVTETINFGFDPTQFASNTLAQVYQNNVGEEWVIST